MGALPTFQAFLLGEGIELRELSIVDKDLLWSVYDAFIWQRVKELRSRPDLPVSVGVLNQILAEQMIADHLGERWVQKHILNPRLSDQAKGYLDLGDHQLLRALSLHRVQELARRLYQLQSFSWFEPVLDGVRTRKLSGAAFELDALWALQTTSPHVVAKSSSGAKGDDYDSFAVMGERLVPVEIKAKGDDTPWSNRTVINTVKAAAKQFPKGDVGLLFIRVPTAWVGPVLEAEYVNALAEGTRNTARIGAIITALDKPHLTSASTASVSRHFDCFNAPDCPDYIWDFCLQFKSLQDAEVNYLAAQPPF